MEEYLTVEEFASKFKIHPETIRRYIRDGRLEAKIIGKKYMIGEAQEKKFIENCPRIYKGNAENNYGRNSRHDQN